MLSGDVTTLGDMDLLTTGVPNLDRLLGGGLQRGSMALVLGPPGTGKTILAQQLAFHLARQGQTVLYHTGYSEPHQKLLTHNRSLRYFDPTLIGSRIQFLSLPDLLQRGATEAVQVMVAQARREGASLVVIDGFRGLRFVLGAEQGPPEFLYSLSAGLALLGITMLVLVEGEAEERERFPELTVADVVLALRRERQGSRHRRLLEVLKVRGAAALEGVHPYAIDTAGVTVFPRLEAVVPPGEATASEERAPFALPALDAMLGGGVTAGTATLVAGSPGTGKTVLGLQFLAAGLARDEAGLFLGFMESAEQLRVGARHFGQETKAAEAAGRLRLLALPAYDLEADRIADLLLRDIAARGVRRLVIDSATELARSAGDIERQTDFLAALVSALRNCGVTTYVTLDMATVAGPELHFGGTPLAVLAENLLLLRQTEYRGRLHRFCMVLKMRFSATDPTIHAYTIRAGAGFSVLGPAPQAAGLLTGLVQPSDAALGDIGPGDGLPRAED